MTGPILLFGAAKRGVPVAVRHARGTELAALAGEVGREASLDALDTWSIVAIGRADGSGATLHALGWRVGMVNTWITSPLRAVDLAGGAVRTSSGKVYALGEPDDPELHPLLREHLAYALRTWGFDDVRG